MATTLLACSLAALPGCAAAPEGAGRPEAESAAAQEGVGTGAGSADAAAAHEVHVAATKEHVRLVGRTYEEDGVTWLPQSGSAVEFRATCSQVSVELVGDDSVSGEPERRPRFAVLLDGEVVVDDILNEPSRTVEVALGESGQGVVEVMHLSEAQFSQLGVAGITVRGARDVSVAPTSARSLSIEFIGDSITCGYGVEAANPDVPFSTKTENFMASYAYLTAKALNADYSTVCYSGHGVVSGWTADGTRNDKMLLPPLYELVAKGREQQWDFSAHRPDVVVVNLGTNDFTYTGTRDDRLQGFAEGYEALLGQVREHNPEARIVCALGTMGGHELYPALERAVESFRAKTGDARVTCHLLEEIDYEHDGAGTMNHPNTISQQKCADEMVRVIREALKTDGLVASAG